MTPSRGVIAPEAEVAPKLEKVDRGQNDRVASYAIHQSANEVIHRDRDVDMVTTAIEDKSISRDTNLGDSFRSPR